MIAGALLPSGPVAVRIADRDEPVQPRPEVRRPGDAALVSHDGRIAAAGIATPGAAICFGSSGGGPARIEFLERSLEAILQRRKANARETVAEASAPMAVVGDAPNEDPGGAHSGDVAAFDLAGHRLLDARSSDYVAAGLLHAALRRPDRHDRPLARAIDLASDGPARMVGLAAGRRADLVRVRRFGAMPAVRAVGREGRCVA